MALEPKSSVSVTNDKLKSDLKDTTSSDPEDFTNLLPREVTTFPLRHGPTRTKESLLDIAGSYSIPGASSSQIAIALYRYNQDAFIRGDINRLRTGVTLEIPHRDAVLQSTKGVANMELQHLIRGEPVVVSLPRIASQATEFQSEISPDSQQRQPPELDKPLAKEQSGDAVLRDDKLISQAKTQESQGPSKSVTYPLKFGPVRPGQSLESVARSMAPDDASLPQTALALYFQNPKAFINGDIRKLRSGAKLSLPNAQSIFGLAPEIARAKYLSALSGQPITADSVQLAAASREDRPAEQASALTPPLSTPGEVIPGAEEIPPDASPTQRLAMAEDKPIASASGAAVSSKTSSGPGTAEVNSIHDEEQRPSHQPEASEKTGQQMNIRPSEADHLVIATHSPPAPALQAAEQPNDQHQLASTLTLATSPTASTSNAPQASHTDLQREMLLLREAAAANHQENAHLQARVAELEAQIANMQKLLQLSSDQLNQLLELVTKNTSQPLQQLVARNDSATASAGDLPWNKFNAQFMAESIDPKTLAIFLLIVILLSYIAHLKLRRPHQIKTIASNSSSTAPPPSVPVTHSSPIRPSPIRPEADATLSKPEISIDLPRSASSPSEVVAATNLGLPAHPAIGDTGEKTATEQHRPLLADIIAREPQGQPSLDASQEDASSVRKATGMPDELSRPPAAQLPDSNPVPNDSPWHASMEFGDEIEEKIDLSMAYIQTHRTGSARELLQEVILKGNPDQQALARSMLNRLS